MGCSSNKSTKPLPVIFKKDLKSDNKNLNPHNEDDAAEVIDEGKQKTDRNQEELDRLAINKKDESKTAVTEVSLMSKSFPMNNYSDWSVVQKQREGFSVQNLSKVSSDKPNFEKVEHKFEFDLGLEEGGKDEDEEDRKIIRDVIEELNDV